MFIYKVKLGLDNHQLLTRIKMHVKHLVAAAFSPYTLTVRATDCWLLLAGHCLVPNRSVYEAPSSGHGCSDSRCHVGETGAGLCVTACVCVCLCVCVWEPESWCFSHRLGFRQILEHVHIPTGDLLIYIHFPRHIHMITKLTPVLPTPMHKCKITRTHTNTQCKVCED